MKVISFSLYGNESKYTIGAINNSKLHKKLFTDWEMRVYHNNTTSINILNELKDNGVNLINTNEDRGFINSTWRFFPLSENVDYFISRDCDSRISERDEIAVSEWIESNKSFHIIRDHPVGHSWVINAGMWGGKGRIITNIKELMDNYIKNSANYNRNRTTDQMFLRDILYPIIKNDCLIHDEYYNYENIGIPIKRDRKIDNFAFIGEAIAENDLPLGDQRSPIIEKYYKK